MRILLVDDEPLARARLKRILTDMPAHQVVGEVDSADTILSQIEQTNPDVLLLDIQMPGVDGLTAAQQLSVLKTPPAIIFVTAFPEHALEAFDSHASGYLLKPVSAAALATALDRAQRATRAQMATAKAEHTQFITAVIHGERHRIAVDSISAFLAEDKYTRIRHDGGECLIEESLKSLETRFPAFIRIHRQCLVARARITSMDRKGQLQVQGCNEKMMVSRRCLNSVRKLLTVSG